MPQLDDRTLNALRQHVPWRRALLGLFALFAIALAASIFFNGELKAFGGDLMRAYGLLGLALGVVIIDTCTPGFPFETLVYLGIAAGEDWAVLAGVAGSASALAGIIDYGIGRFLDRFVNLSKRQAHSPLLGHLKTHGAVWLAVAAITPLPYSMMNWLAGALRIPFRHCAMACTLRLPRAYLFTYLMWVSWQQGAGL
jgi:membrane protein YqaA with SNARE-associated domain